MESENEQQNQTNLKLHQQTNDNLLKQENEERFSSSSNDSSDELVITNNNNNLNKSNQSNHHRISLKRRKKLIHSNNHNNTRITHHSEPIINHGNPISTSLPSLTTTTTPYSNQPILPSSSSNHHHHHHHHYHHLYHLQHQFKNQQQLILTNQSHHSPLPSHIPLNIPRSNSEHSSSTTCIDSLDSNINLSPIPSNTSPQHHNTVPLPQSNLFHSHHLTTSSHPHNTTPFPHSTPRHHLHHISDSSRFTNSSELSAGLDIHSHPPKTSWFSSRRSKRKDSIHALSATPTSSTTSLHSFPSPSDPYGLKNFDSLLPKYPLASSSVSSSRRSSLNQLKRLLRSSISCPSLSLRWLKKSFRPRLPLGILLGLLVFISFAVSLTVFLIHYLDTDKEPLPWRTYCQEQREFPHELAESLEPVNVFVGVFSIDSAYERRHLIRSTYARHSRPIDPLTGQISHNVQLKFVLGKPRIQHVRRIALEMETYNDIVVLDIQENMNRGKTYAFLSWAAENATIPVYYHPLHESKPKMGVNGIGGVMKPDPMHTINVSIGFKKADFVVKADDDAFIVLSELERHLRVAPRTMTYWGYLIRNLFMGGECYALSADLVNYVANSDKVLDHLTGAEDKKVAKWMRIHPNATDINWVTERCWIYDHPKAGTTYSHGFLFPDQVQRIREEGKQGLSESEIESRGPGRTQSYSSVIKWKQRYVAPKSLMTMEEEVEALVEGGGRFSKTDWKRPMGKQTPIPVAKVLFDSDDHRLLKSSILGGPASIKSSAPLPGQFTPSVKDHYQEPSLKFGRPPNELMATMPPMEDLPESLLKEKLREGLTGEISNQSQPPNSSSKSDERIPSLNHKKDKVDRGKENHPKDDDESEKEPQFVPPPTLRFDPEDMRIRNERFLNLPYGGTVVVHYLKRNEWFLETSLILLGRSKTWDDGLIPVVYQPSHQMRPASRHGLTDQQPDISSIEPVRNSVVVSSSPSSLDQSASTNSKAVSTLDRSPSLTDNRGHINQKKIQVSDVTDWGKFDQVEQIGVAGMFGGARMFGSPVIESDGTISEGRRKTTALPATSSLRPGEKGPNNNDHRGVESQNGEETKHVASLDRASDNSVDTTSVGNQVDQGRHQIRADNDDQKVDDIRKTQFGGAGWIRGKPRLRVADPSHGPQFANHQSVLSKPDPSVDPPLLEEHITLDSTSNVEPEQDEQIKNNNPFTTNINSSNSKINVKQGKDEDNDDDQDEFNFGNGSDSSLILDKDQHESFHNPSLSGLVANPVNNPLEDHYHNANPDRDPDGRGLFQVQDSSTNGTLDEGGSSQQNVLG